MSKENEEDPLSVANEKYKRLKKQDAERRGIKWHWSFTLLIIIILFIIIFYGFNF